MKKRKVNPYKVIKILFIVLFFLAAPFVIRNIFRGEDTTFIKVVDSLELYSYELREDDTDYQKEVFYELKRVLNEDEIDEQEYVKYLGKLFIVDFYTINTKINNQDIGGVNFVHEDSQEYLTYYARDTEYAHVESRLGRARTQVLPIVSEVNLIEVKEMGDYVENVTFTAYYEINYSNKEKLEGDPPEKIEIIMSYVDEKLVIVDFTPNEEKQDN